MLLSIKQEFRKVFTRFPLLMILVIVIASTYFLLSGISYYRERIDNLEIDAELDNQKADYYFSYNQYSVMGHNALLKPSPMIVFFHSSTVFEVVESHIDTSEVVKIVQTLKGKEIFYRRGNIKDFGGFINVFGSIGMLILGVLTFKNRSFLFGWDRKFFSHIISRMVVYDFLLFCIMGSMFLLALLKGLNFSQHEMVLYFVFILSAALFLNLSYLLGTFFSNLFKNYPYGLLSATLTWALLVLVIPDARYLNLSNKDLSSGNLLNFTKTKKLMNTEIEIRKKIDPFLKAEKRDMKKIKSIMAQGVRDYASKGYKKNKAMEQAFHNNLKANIKGSDNLACYLPWSFFTVLQENISSKGYDAYLGFVEFVMNLRDRFFYYIYKKRYLSNDKKVIPFIPKGANIYESKSKLPDRFLIGLITTILWSLVFLILAYLLFRRRVKAFDKSVFAVNPDRLPKDKNFFLLCKDKQDYEKCLNDKDEYPHVTMLADPSEIRYDPGVNWLRWIKFICIQENLNFSRVMELLGLMEITESKLKKAPQPEDQDLFKRIYLALKLAEPKHVYVFDNFLKRESPEFEEIFKKVLKSVAGKKLYVSTHPMTHLAEIEENLHTDGQIITIDITSPYYILR